MARNSSGAVDTTFKSYQAVIDGVAAVQKKSMMLALGMVEDTFSVFERQAEINLRMMEMLVEQASRQGEVSRALVKGGMFDLPRTDVGERCLPIEDYDRLSVEEIGPRLEQLDARGVEELKDYEMRHKNRRPLLERLDRALV